MSKHNRDGDILSCIEIKLVALRRLSAEYEDPENNKEAPPDHYARIQRLLDAEAVLHGVIGGAS